MAAKTVRLSTTQRSWRPTPPNANPFCEAFSLEAARAHSRASVDEHAALVARAGEQGADLTVTGEGIEGLSYAITYLDDPSIFCTLVQELSEYCRETMSALAKRHRMHVVACFYEAQDDAIYNSAVLFGRDGAILGRYHKVNLPIYETWLVTNGDSFPVFDTDLGPVGLLICYDEMWPEAASCLALNGAKIICHPSAAVIEEHTARTRSMDNQVFYVSSTPARSIITAPNAQVLALAGDEPEAVLTADADVATATLSPENFWEYVYSGLRDHRERHLKLRQAAAYRVLSDPNPPALRAYPDGGLANTPERIREVYEKQKADYQRSLRGEKSQYEWKWSDWSGGSK